MVLSIALGIPLAARVLAPVVEVLSPVALADVLWPLDLLLIGTSLTVLAAGQLVTRAVVALTGFVRSHRATARDGQVATSSVQL